MRSRYVMIATAWLGLLAATASAAVVDVTLTIRNLAPANNISFAPLRFGFHNGSFPSFNVGQAAAAPIISIAEGGGGADWYLALAAAEPQAVLGSSAAPQTPSATQTRATSGVDTAVNPFFTFASMVVPSIDFFIGNDDPREYRLFDGLSNLLLSQIDQTASEIWDAGWESFGPASAAFLAGGNSDLPTPQSGVVSFNVLGLAGFNGLLTSAGYTFDSNLIADLPVYQSDFSATAVPAALTWAALMTGLVGMVLLGRRWTAARPEGDA